MSGRMVRGVVLTIAACLVAMAAFGCAGNGASQPSSQPGADTSGSAGSGELVVAIAGMVTPKSALEYYLNLSEYVGNKVGRKVRLIHKSDYAQVNQLLKEGKVDVAFVCSGPYVTGHDDFGLELLAAPVVNGAQTYRSYTIVPKSSDATSLASLRGKVFAFTDPESNSGRVIPTYTLAKMGTTPKEFFKEVIFTYSHDNSIKYVAEGRVAGAAVDSLIWDFNDATDPTYTSKTKIIAMSDTCAIPPVVVRPGLDTALKEGLRAAFLGANEDPQGAALLAKMRIDRFDTIEDSAYNSVREMEAWVAAHQQ